MTTNEPTVIAQFVTDDGVKCRLICRRNYREALQDLVDSLPSYNPGPQVKPEGKNEQKQGER
ncbi:MAG: hypothetical protein R2932_49220 [Caldilineaceae bacterium]